MNPVRLALRNLLFARPRMAAATVAVACCLCVLDLYAGYADSRRLWLGEHRENELRLALVGMLVAVAAAVGSTLSMNAFERRREYATLRALGMRKAHLFMLVEAEALWITLAGALLGLLASGVAAPVINRLAEWVAGQPQTRSTVLLTANGQRLGAVVVAVLAVALLAALVPAIKAARADVAEGLAGDGGAGR